VAASAACRRRNLVIFDELCGPFIVTGHLTRAPIQIRDLIQRAQVRGRSAMAVQAETHAERLCVSNDFHLVDLAVALIAGNTAADVDGVVEINVVRKFVHSLPVDRITRRVAGADRREQRAVRLDVRVAVHAGLRRRQIGPAGLLDIAMAVAAIDA